MYRAESESLGEEPEQTWSDEVVIDFDDDPVEIRDLDENDQGSTGFYSDEPSRRIDNADLDNVLDEFVDVLNGRDLDGLAELFSADVEAEFLGESSRDGVVSGLNDLILRNPTLVVTRADLGSDPIAAVWTFDQGADAFDPFGYLALQLSESDEGLIQRIDYVEDLGDSEDLVAEVPDRSELPEWWDWAELDED